MAYFDQGQFDLRCEWGVGGVEQLAQADVTIIVDVLSFTTSVDVAVSRGAIVLPYQSNDEKARQYALERNAELAGPRNRLDGGYSLSPSSLMNTRPGLRLVLPSPNGSALAISAMSRGNTVMAGCLRNASAIAGAAGRVGKRIAVIPAGERWLDGTLRPAVEDWVGAGAILRSMSGTRSPEAQSAIAAFDSFSKNLLDRLLLCTSGRELVERGFGHDVELATQLDISAVVPILRGEAFTAGSPF